MKPKVRQRAAIAGLGAGLGATLAAAVPAGSDAIDPERVLRKEIVVEAPIEKVWSAWTTEEGLRFASKASNVDQRIGGPYELFLNLEPDARGKRGSEDSRVLAFAPGEMLAFDWTFPPDVPTLRESGAKTQAVVLLDDLGDGSVRVRFIQHGWGVGDDWDAGYAYFDEGWDRVLARLKSHLEDQP